MIELRIKPTAGQIYTKQCDAERATIGRNPDSFLQFDSETDDQVSWDHALIECRNGAAFLSDLGSTNGTFLGNKEIKRRTVLKQGDEITLGRTGPTIYIVKIAASPEALTSGQPEKKVEQDQVQHSEPANRRADDQYQLSAHRPALIVGGICTLGLLGLLVVTFGGAGSGLSPAVATRQSTTMPEPVPGPGTPSPAQAAESDPFSDPVLTSDEIAARYGRSTVWLGAKVEDTTYLTGTGVIVAPKTVLTSARNLAALASAKGRGAALIVSSEPSGRSTARIVRTQYHPRYKLSETTCDQSLASNAGLLHLDTAISPVAKLRPSSATSYSGTSITVVALTSRIDSKGIPILKDNQPTRLTIDGTIFGTSGADGYCNIFELESGGYDLNGAPVFGSAGEFVGILSVYKNQFTVAPSYQLLSLLAATLGKGDSD